MKSKEMYREYATDNGQILIYEDEFNRRVRLDEYEGDPGAAVQSLEQHLPVWTEKIIAKVRPADVPRFISRAYSCEAFIAGYFSGTDMYFLVKYFLPGRERSSNWQHGQNILEDVLASTLSPPLRPIPEIRLANPDDASRLAAIFGEVFPVYPSPLSDASYVEQSMVGGKVYAYISEKGKILSAASAEINRKFKNAELTDCATMEIARGKGHMQQLLRKLENVLDEMGITCLYTIARSDSYGINKAFFNLGYTYGGRLINNCYIYSGLEDMNVWYKANSLTI